MHAQQRARQQLKGFLLRHGYIWEGKSSWTRRHFDWMRGARFQIETHRQVFEDYLQEVVHAGERLRHLTELLEQAAMADSFAPQFRALQALRGVSVIVAATLVAELGDLRRFAKPTKLMSYLGLTPSEYSSGSHTQRGAITKAGNSHVRRALIEAAWSARLTPKVSTHLKRRSSGLPLPVQEIVWKAQRRLHARYWKLTRRGKSQQVTIVALARELTGFVWAIGRQVA